MDLSAALHVHTNKLILQWYRYIVHGVVHVTVVLRKRAHGWYTLHVYVRLKQGVGRHSKHQYCVLLSAQSSANSA